MEVIYDLDAEGKATAERGSGCATSGWPHRGTPDFVAMVRELLLERAAVERSEARRTKVARRLPASHDVCAVDCCFNPRSVLPTIA
ncbi:hypothetical protein [Aeromicrobium sp. UC242_57]|uniref:hypothetical protein n=1 Tax=Aeromicrobium sp. UC242_57 TaxID=3374624 RepID=UPI0037938706